MTSYNGYTNYETWNFSMHHGDILQEQIQEYQDEHHERLEHGQVYHMVEGYIDNMMEQSEHDNDDYFISDMLGMAIQRIDIHQITSNIIDELEYEQEY